jgi:hypothetical protein
MVLEYFEDPDASPSRVLLLYGPTGPEVERLCAELATLASGAATEPLRVDLLPGIAAVGGCSLLADLGQADLGVQPEHGERPAFRCVLTAEGWLRVVGLLGPFLSRGREKGFQYLTEAGLVEWIISDSRSW